MTTDSATCSTIFAVPDTASRCSDPVRARVAAPPQLTNYQILQASAPHAEDAVREHRGLRLLAGGSTSRRRAPHPGDILYWIACLGGACLLLLTATT